MRIAATLLFLASSLVPAAAFSGVVRGTVSGMPVAASGGHANAYPGRANSLPGTRGGAHGTYADAVVYVDRVPARAESALAARPMETPKLAQKDQSFVPRVLVVAVGTRVDFPNQDPIYHNVFSLSPVQRFDLGKYPKGDSRTVVFRKPGIVNVFCDIHSDMAAFVMVLPHHGFTRPAASGEFSLPELPKGRYVLHAWHPDLGEQKTEVDVPASGAVTVKLEFRR